MLEAVFERDQFVKEFDIAVSVCSKSSDIQHIKVQAESHNWGSFYSLQAYDGELRLGSRACGGCEIITEGDVLVPFSASKLISSIPSSHFRIFANKDDLIISAENESRQPSWRMGVASRDFPASDPGTLLNEYLLPGSEFADALNQVLPAVSGRFVSPQLSFVNLHTNPVSGFLEVRAYGGAEYRCAEIEGIEDSIEMLVPGRASQQASHLYDVDEMVQLDVMEHALYFISSLYVFESPKPKTIYPDLDKYVLEPIPENVSPVEVQAKDLQTALRRVKPMLGSSGAVEVRVRSDHLELRTWDEQGNTARDDVGAACPGEPVHFAVNIARLESMLSVAQDSKGIAKILIGPEKRDRPGLIYFSRAGFKGHLEQMRLDLVRGSQ